MFRSDAMYQLEKNMVHQVHLVVSWVRVFFFLYFSFFVGESKGFRVLILVLLSSAEHFRVGFTDVPTSPV